MKYILSSTLILAVSPTLSSAFSVGKVTPTPTRETATVPLVSLHAKQDFSRRSILQKSIFASSAAAAFVMGSNIFPAFADDSVDDLAMPTEDEQAKAVSVPTTVFFFRMSMEDG